MAPIITKAELGLLAASIGAKAISEKDGICDVIWENDAHTTISIEDLRNAASGLNHLAGTDTAKSLSRAVARFAKTAKEAMGNPGIDAVGNLIAKMWEGNKTGAIAILKKITETGIARLAEEHDKNTRGA